MEANATYREPIGPISCAWGYILTRDQRYLQTVRDSLSWLTEFPPLVKSPEGANFPFIQQAYALGAVYDLLYSDWSDSERQRIEKVLRETVFRTLAYKVTTLDKDINFWADDPYSNYYVVYHSTAGLVAIALAGVEPDAERLASLCWDRVKRSMDVFARGHGWREGLTYLDFCWGQSACYFLLAVERNSNLRPFDYPWFSDSVTWASWGALPDRATIACFGDNEPENYSVGSYLGRVGALTADVRYTQESDATGKVVDLAVDLPVFKAACLGRAPNGPSVMESGFYQGLWRRFDDIEWGVIRTGSNGAGRQDENDFYCAFKSGVAGYDHNHLDQGHMILGAFSEVLLSDPGRGGPDIIRRDPPINCLFEAGLGHNTLIVGDGCYMDLGLFPDNPRYFARPGTITSQEETAEYIQFTTDNSGLYPTEPLTQFQRTFIYIKPGVIPSAELGALVIADHVAFSRPVEHSILFHTPGQVELTGLGRARLINGGARLDYAGYSDVPSVDKVERQETGMPSRDSSCYYRSTESTVAENGWVHVLTPHRADAPPTPEPQLSVDPTNITAIWTSYSLSLLYDSNTGWVVAPATQPGTN
jgi:hypothetical protein